VLSVNLVNKNGDEIPLWKGDELVLSSNVVRQVRTYLQPIPVGVGTLIGFLLFGIVGVFRRSGRRTKPAPPRTTTYVGRKGL
jgi:hypothetical protein